MNEVKPHFHIVSISNFKRFKKEIKFEIKPITILVGPNGSGKSTVIEALDIFSRSLKFLSGECSDDFLNKYSFDELISDKSKKHFKISVFDNIENQGAAIYYKENNGSPSLDILELNNLTLRTNKEEKFSKKIYLNSKKKYDLKNFRINLQNIDFTIDSNSLSDDTRKPPPPNFTATNGMIKEDFYDLAATLLNVSPSEKKILEDWLSRFEIADKIEINQIGELNPNTKFYEILLSKNDKYFNLSSLSSGGKQLIPIILGCLEYNLVKYVKQPELHLHPKLQMLLADFFVFVKKDVDTFFTIIETHSEHLIRKFQLLIAKGEVKPNEIQVLYFQVNEKDNSSNLRVIPFNDRGMFTEPWPNGFFEESAVLNIQLIEEILSRKN